MTSLKYTKYNSEASKIKHLTALSDRTLYQALWLDYLTTLLFFSQLQASSNNPQFPSSYNATSLFKYSNMTNFHD
jgi:hypothetical protein